jgi:surface protein
MINDSIQDSGLLADRTPCDDDNPDTIQDYYENGICVGHYSYSCEDGEGVTKDELITLINDDEDVTAVCTSNITDMSYMFYKASDFNQPLNNWDTSSVENMSYMFYDARAMNSDITTWKTRNVNNMIYMFRSADVFNQDLSKWNVPLIETRPTDFDYATLDDWTDSMKPVW